jgi:hypothetical protein
MRTTSEITFMDKQEIQCALRELIHGHECKHDSWIMWAERLPGRAAENLAMADRENQRLRGLRAALEYVTTH